MNLRRKECMQFAVAAIMTMTALLLPAAAATAAVKNWTAGNGNWNTGANWTGGTVPMGSDTVRIFFNDGVARTITYDVSAPALGLLSIGLTGPGATINTLSLPSNNTLTATGIRVGGFNGITSDTGRGAVTQSAGTTTISPGSDLFLAYGNSSTGTYTLGGGALVANQSEYIGYSGTGTFNHTVGTNTATGNLYLGYNNGSVGNYILSGGTLSVGNDFIVGDSGTGTLTIQGTGSTFTNNLSINSVSTVNLNGGTLRFNSIGGTGGLSRLNYTAGTIQLSGPRSLASDPIITALFGTQVTIPSGKGLIVELGGGIVQSTVRVNGGSLSAAVMDFGTNGHSELEIDNGGIVTNSVAAYVGFYDETATVSVSGPGSMWNVNGLTLAMTAFSTSETVRT